MRKLAMLVAVVALFGLPACQEMREEPPQTADRLVEWSADTIDNFARLPQLKDFAGYIPGARGLLIVPSSVKAGFLVGAEGGSGVLIARTADGGWGYPAFYTVGAASFGLQIGVQDVETVLVIRNDGALHAMIKHQGKLGADMGVTGLFYGAGMGAATTTNLKVDVLAFTNAKIGAYAGASVEGTALVRRRDMNEAFYGAGATPEAIVLEGRYRNPKADKLRSVLDRFR